MKQMTDKHQVPTLRKSQIFISMAPLYCRGIVLRHIYSSTCTELLCFIL